MTAPPRRTLDPLALAALAAATFAAFATFAFVAAAAAAEPPRTTVTRSSAQILADAPASAWREPDPAHTLYMDLPGGRVIIELAPAFAPLNVAAIERLARQQYFDGAAVVRVQDNFVAQWSRPDDALPKIAPPPGIAPEFTRPLAGLSFDVLPDPDTYAPEVGFVAGLPTARDRARGEAWLAHCYAMVGVGRDNAPESGSGGELYAVIGQAPRALDRNITLVGRVLRGMDLLSSLPRGTGVMGFYTSPVDRLQIRSMRIAADLPPKDRLPLEVLRTDTTSFAELVEARRNRHDEWYQRPAGRIDLCSVAVPVRLRPAAGAAAGASAP